MSSEEKFTAKLKAQFGEGIKIDFLEIDNEVLIDTEENKEVWEDDSEGT